MRRYRIWFQFDGVLELGVRYEKAREHFNRALQLDPEYGDAIVELAEIYIHRILRLHERFACGQWS